MSLRMLGAAMAALMSVLAIAVPVRAMPAFSGKLSDTQIWNLANYLRSLSQVPLPTQ